MRSLKVCLPASTLCWSWTGSGGGTCTESTCTSSSSSSIVVVIVICAWFCRHSKFVFWPVSHMKVGYYVQLLSFLCCDLVFLIITQRNWWGIFVIFISSDFSIHWQDFLLSNAVSLVWQSLYFWKQVEVHAALGWVSDIIIYSVHVITHDIECS